MDKIKSDRQIKGGCMLLWFTVNFVLSAVFYRAWNITRSGLLQMATTVCLVAGIIPFFYSAVIWAYSNRIERGIKYAWKHYRLALGLRKQLLNAGIYTTQRLGAVKWAKIPWIVVDFAPDFKSGTVWIRNSIQFNDKLSRIDISSSLGRYVVEQVYLTDNENHYRFDFYDSSLERRLSFDSFGAFKAHSDLLGNYELFIDSYTNLTLTHQLIAGQTGSGKTYALHGYLLQMLIKPIPYHLYFADPKASSIALLGEKVSPENTADDFDRIVSLLETFVSRMQERQQEMKRNLEEKIDGDYRDFELAPHILIFDEFADFSMLLQSKEKKMRDHVESLLSAIVLKGRQSGFFIWIVMQQAGSNNLPTYIRDNLPCKVVLGNAEEQTYVTAFGRGADIPPRKMKAGDGVFTYPAIANKPRLCEFPTLDFDILKSLEAGVM
ncbi:MAG: FtsK/SpoIIIE domain-containing protein [Clostridium sp.]|nr:FtsK/SpoIIIE domain-containing protein [Clostridium sp.]